MVTVFLVILHILWDAVFIFHLRITNAKYDHIANLKPSREVAVDKCQAGEGSQVGLDSPDIGLVEVGKVACQLADSP